MDSAGPLLCHHGRARLDRGRAPTSGLGFRLPQTDGIWGRHDMKRSASRAIDRLPWGTRIQRRGSRQVTSDSPSGVSGWTARHRHEAPSLPRGWWPRMACGGPFQCRPLCQRTIVGSVPTHRGQRSIPRIIPRHPDHLLQGCPYLRGRRQVGPSTRIFAPAVKRITTDKVDTHPPIHTRVGVSLTMLDRPFNGYSLGRSLGQNAQHRCHILFSSGVPRVIHSGCPLHLEYLSVSLTMRLCPPAFLAILCLTVLLGNSAGATLLPSEYLGRSRSNGQPFHGSLLPEFLGHDSHGQSWNSAGHPIPEIQFDLLRWSPADGLPQGVNRAPEVSSLSELRLSAPPLQNDPVSVKGTYLAAQLLARQKSVREFIQTPNQLPNFRRSSQFRPNSSLSWVTKVEFSVYASLALLALGAVVLNVVRWYQRRREFLKFQSFVNIGESELQMARFPLGPPPGTHGSPSATD
jgi:hypothetical protein